MDERNFSRIEGQSIGSLGIFSEEEVKYLDSYGISTVGGLLGSTNGFLKVDLFSDFEDGNQKLEQLEIKIPNAIREKYQTFSEEYPKGWLGGIDGEEFNDEAE